MRFLLAILVLFAVGAYAGDGKDYCFTEIQGRTRSAPAGALACSHVRNKTDAQAVIDCFSMAVEVGHTTLPNAAKLCRGVRSVKQVKRVLMCFADHARYGHPNAAQLCNEDSDCK